MFESDAVDKAAGKEASPAVPLERAFEPAVLALLVHEHDVALLQLQLGLALWRVRHHHAVPGQEQPTALILLSVSSPEIQRPLPL